MRYISAYVKKTLFIFFTILIFTPSLHSYETLYLMPRDAKNALKALGSDLEQARKSIKITIYSFTHKALAKSLKKAAARGVHVTVIFDAEQNKGSPYTRLGDLAKIKNIDTYTIKGLPNKKKGYYGKMHMKMAVIDDKKAYFGSANWSYSAFSRNYELLYATDSAPIVRQNSDYFDTMLKKALPY